MEIKSIDLVVSLLVKRTVRYVPKDEDSDRTTTEAALHSLMRALGAAGWEVSDISVVDD